MNLDHLTARDLTQELEPVTQILFSAHLIADVLPRLWDRDRAEGEQRLAELCQLTNQALFRMEDLLDQLTAARAQPDQEE